MSLGEVWGACRRELVEAYWAPGVRRTQIAAWLVLVGVLGVLLPWVLDRWWLRDDLMLYLLFFLLPMLLAFRRTAGGFAGEGRRRMLEALRMGPPRSPSASPSGSPSAARAGLRALWLGKSLAAAAYAYATVVASSLVSLATMNVWLLVRGEGPTVYPPPVWFGMVVTSLAVTLFAVWAGVLISLRFSRATAAHSTTLALAVVSVLALRAATRMQTDWGFLLPATGALAVLDAGLGWLAGVRVGQCLRKALDGQASE